MNDSIFAMGGYAAYVWPSVLLVLGVLGWNIWSAMRQLAQAQACARRAQTAKESVQL